MKKKNLYPWLMMLLLFEFLFFMMPGMNSTVNLFVVPVSEELGVSRSVYSLSFAVSSGAMVALSFFYGKIYKRFGARKIILLTGVFALAACFVSAKADHIAVIYLGALLRGIVLGLGSTAIVGNVLFNWFNQYRGLVMGITFSAVGFGGAALMPVFTYWVAGTNVGWRDAYLYIGGIVFVSCIIAGLLIKGSPEEVDAIPFGEDITNRMDDKAKESNSGASLKTILKSAPFIASAVIVLLVNFSLYSTYAHLQAYLDMKNCDLAIIASALSILAFAVGGAKLVYGFVSDKFGMRVTALMAASFHVLSLALLLFGKTNIIFLLGCIVLGFGIGALQLSVSLFAGIFGKEHYSFIVGIFSAELGLAWGIGPWLTGLYYDLFGNYQGIFSLFLVFGVIMGGFAFMMPKKQQERLDSKS